MLTPPSHTHSYGLGCRIWPRAGCDYPDWDLREVIPIHRDRLQNFLFYKGGFASQVSAKRFQYIVLAFAAKLTLAKYTIQVLREKYLALRKPQPTDKGKPRWILTLYKVFSTLYMVLTLRMFDFRSDGTNQLAWSTSVVLKGSRRALWLKHGEYHINALLALTSSRPTRYPVILTSSWCRPIPYQKACKSRI